MKSLQEILKATRYRDIFSDNKDDAKREFREYCKLYHPDVDSSDLASEAFSIVQELYNHKIRKASINKESIVIINKATGKGFELSNAIAFNNGICIVYHTSTKVVLLYDKTYEKFYKNYIAQVGSLAYENRDMQDEFSRYFPKIISHFETEDDKYCILLDKTREVLNLGLIVKAYRDKGELFPEKQAAWILNRLYNIVCYSNHYKKVFNGLCIDNLWVSPEMHTVLVFNGWEYLTGVRENMLGCHKEVYKILPIKVKDTKESNIVTDLESIKAIGRILYNGHNLEHIDNFLKAGITSNNPLDEWKAYGKAINKHFGKRKFIEWVDVPYSK